MRRLLQRAWHLLERIIREIKRFPKTARAFGAKVAFATFWDGLHPLGKQPRYIATVETYVDRVLEGLVQEYQSACDEPTVKPDGKLPVWCCWWQGEETMPELVKLCHNRLKQVLPSDAAELHLITLDNYKEYVDIPAHILEKFEKGIITMTTMSDVLRFALLSRYGGYWLDATVFFTGDIPKEYFSGGFFCQRMAGDAQKVSREACKGNWCGFSMTGPKNSTAFRFMCDAFSKWWSEYDTIIDYVLIDYMLWTGFRKVPAIHEMIDRVPDNNEDIFAMYGRLNEPYTPELYAELTQRNVMHKLTYKMDLRKETADGRMTLYGYLWKMVTEAEG